MTFGAPLWFWGLLVLPVLALLFVRSERRSAQRLEEFVSPRLLPQLAGTIDRFRRATKFILLLVALALAITSLAKPRWGYTYEEVKRKGLDLIFAVDTSRSMLSNDIPPNRLQRVKLAAQDLISLLQGDRVGLIAFAGRAFLQAPLTIDYDAAVEAINDLDTSTIPEGGTNISEAITLATRTYGKSAIGNRALIIFTDGEDLSGDSAKTAKAAADAGVRIFTIGVGTPEGSLIPISGESGGTAFVKDSKGQVVKSKLDEKRLREIAQKTGGLYLPLGSGQRTMQQLFAEGLSKMQAGQIDDRPARRPIERYEWPLGTAFLALAASLLMRERKRIVHASRTGRKREAVMAIAALVLASSASGRGAAPGMDAYRNEKFDDAYRQFQQTLRDHPRTAAADKLQFDAGTAAYKLKEYGKALESFSQALLSPERPLQEQSHYNLGNTLYQRGESEKSDDKKETDWNGALQHYEQALKLNPDNKEAKDNLEYVKRKLAELKQKREQQPTPTPSPSPQNKDKKSDKSDQKEKNQPQKGGGSPQDKQQDQQDKSGEGEKDKPQNGQDKSQSKNERGKDEQRNEQSKPGESSSPGPSSGAGSSPTPSPGAGGEKAEQSPSPGDQSQPSPSPEGEGAGSPSPSPGGGGEKPSPAPESGEGGQDEQPSPSASPVGSPNKNLSGEVKGANSDKPDPASKEAQIAAEAEANKEGQMSAEQAERLLGSMKDEEERVQLDERKAVRRVYNDW